MNTRWALKTLILCSRRNALGSIRTSCARIAMKSAKTVSKPTNKIPFKFLSIKVKGAFQKLRLNGLAKKTAPARTPPLISIHHLFYDYFSLYLKFKKSKET